MSYSAERSPTLPEVLRIFGESLKRSIFTMLPGKVESYDASRKSVDVKPMVQNEFINERGETISESLPVISDVPIIYPEGQLADGTKTILNFPVAKGSYVMLLFSQRSLDKYIAGNGEEVSPTDLKTHHISDAVAIPGLAPYAERPSQSVSDNGLLFGLDNGTQIFVGNNSIGLGSENPADKAVLDSSLQNELSRLKSELDQITAWMRAINTTLAVSIPEPGNGSPSALGTALNIAVQATPVPTPANPGQTNSEVVTLD